MYSMIQLVGIKHLLPHPIYVCMYLFFYFFIFYYSFFKF
jgi:hypothetical protein